MKKARGGEVFRWLERLQEYDFTAEHRPGKSHSNADALSRWPWSHVQDCPCSSSQRTRKRVSAITLRSSHWSPEMVREAQHEDPATNHVLTRLSRNPCKPISDGLKSKSHTLRAIWAKFELLEVQNGLYRIKLLPEQSRPSRIVLPNKLVRPLIQELLDGITGAHLGQEKTLSKVKSRFWRPCLSTIIREYCQACLTCAKCKPRQKAKAPLQPMTTGYPMQRVHMDMAGPLPKTKKGNMYILTVQCSFTKWIEAYPMRNQRAVTCTRAFIHNWVCRYGVPDRIHSDQGRNFESTIYKEIYHLFHMDKSRTTPYHPEGNGQIKNFHRILKSLLKAKAEEDPHD